MSRRVILLGAIVLATGGFVVGTTLERNAGESKHESAATLRAEGVSAATNAPAGGESDAVHAAEANRSGATATPTVTRPESEATHAAQRKSATTPNAKGEAGNGGESVASRAAEHNATSTTSTATGAVTPAAHQESARAHPPASTGTPSTSSATVAPAGPINAEGKPDERTAVHAAEKTPTAKAPALPTSTHHAELKPLGINVEAPPFVILAALGSLALGLAAWLRPRWALVLVGVGAAMLLFAVLDVREVFHQSDESKTGLAVLAGAIAAMHAAAAAVAGLMARRAMTGDRAAAGATMAT